MNTIHTTTLVAAAIFTLLAIIATGVQTYYFATVGPQASPTWIWVCASIATALALLADVCAIVAAFTYRLPGGIIDWRN